MPENIFEVTTTGGIHGQIERLYVANLTNIGEISVSFTNMFYEANSDKEVAMLEKQYAKKTATKDNPAGDNVMEWLISDVPYTHWTLPMVMAHTEIRTLTQQNEMLETILAMNKPSLLVGSPDQQE